MQTSVHAGAVQYEERQGERLNVGVRKAWEQVMDERCERAYIAHWVSGSNSVVESFAGGEYAHRIH